MKFLLTGILTILALSPLAEAKYGFYPTSFGPKNLFAESLNAPADAQTVAYYGGPVIGNVKVYAVLWGANVDAPTVAAVPNFYTHIANSDLMDFLDQYNTVGKALDGRAGTNQHIGRGSFAGVVTITPANTNTTVDDTDIQAELQAQIDAGKLAKPDANTLYMTYFPPGMTVTAFGMASCSAFCAYHSMKGTPDGDHFFYGVMPDLGGACAFGCGFDDHVSVVTAISSHEFCEAITDPFPTPGSTPAYPQAWNSSDGSEIGDLCAGSNNTMNVAGGAALTIQSEYDNNAGGCTTRTWNAQ